MTQLLIIGTKILAVGPFSETSEEIISTEIIYPKSTIPDYQINDTSLPEDFSIQTYEWITDHVQKKSVPTPSISPEQAKENYVGMIEIRADALEASGDLIGALLLRESLK